MVGPLLQAALSAGLAAEGVDVVDLGVLPDPGRGGGGGGRPGCPGRGDLGVAQPFADNGIKLFAAGGRKLGDDDEESRVWRARPRRGGR